MAEENGGGRLDQIEALLEKMGGRLNQLTTTSYLHEDALLRIEANFERMQEEQHLREQRLDEHIGKLVSSMRELIDRIPLEKSAQIVTPAPITR